MRTRKLAVGIILGLALCGCGREKTKLNLEMDLFLHPEAAEADDLILQAAIRKRLHDSKAVSRGIVHVRVVDRTVYLRGTVGSEEAKAEAAKIAEATKVVLNGSPPIEVAPPVRNRLEVAR